MSYSESPGQSPESTPPPYFTAEEIFFDEMMAKGQLEQASTFVSAYAESLREEQTDGRYSQALFPANLKEMALPMYRKAFADKTGFSYPESRTEITAMYVRASEMMSDLLASKYDLPSAPYQLRTQEEYRRTIGEASSLTAFALATRNLTGFGDDITMTPSTALQDAGKKLRRLDVRTGFDYIVIDRNREDASYPLQVKTSQGILKAYDPAIAILYMEEFLAPMHVSLEEMQLRIANDSDRHDFTVHRAARRMQHFLANALSDTAEAS